MTEVVAVQRENRTAHGRAAIVFSYRLVGW